MVPYVDAGAYLGHQLSTPVPAESRPRWVTITSAAVARPWRGSRSGPTESGPTMRARLQKDFVSQYMPPAQLNERVKALHRRFPNLTDIIELPNPPTATGGTPRP